MLKRMQSREHQLMYADSELITEGVGLPTHSEL